MLYVHLLAALGTMQGNILINHTIKASRGPASVMVRKGKHVPALHHVTAKTFLLIGIITRRIENKSNTDFIEQVTKKYARMISPKLSASVCNLDF
jgi:hypothetical protein